MPERGVPPDSSPSAHEPDAPRPVLPLSTLQYAPPESGLRSRHWIAILLLAAVLLRVAFSVTRESTPSALTVLPDQVEYLSLAESLIRGQGLFFEDPDFWQPLYAFRMPGYPLLVAVCGTDIRFVRALQALLDTSSVLAIFWTARRLRGETAALLAAAAVAFNPYLIYFSSLVLSETLFTAMLAWGVFLMTCPSNVRRGWGVALLLASVYVRPSAVGLGVAAALAVYATGTTPFLRIKRGVLAGVAAAVLLAVMLAPWAIRNRLVLGQTVWLTTNDGYTAYDSFNPKADGSSNQALFRQGEYDPNAPVGSPIVGWWMMSDRGEYGRSAYLRQLAFDYARSHPRRVAELAVAKLARFWSPFPLSTTFGGQRLYVLVGAAYAVPLFILAVVGVFRGGLGRRATFILLLPAIYFSFVHTVYVGSLRYRVPCDVPLTVLAAAGAMSLVRPKQEPA
ncbi:MAG TPA: hypothetical protein VF595_08770 [Tepidisphaeraceae bacterium]|jgi:hypothetical protein